MKLPPLLDIIRGCSQEEWNRSIEIRRNTRPQDRGLREHPYELERIRVDMDFASMYAGIATLQGSNDNRRVYDVEAIRRNLEEWASMLSENN